MIAPHLGDGFVLAVDGEIVARGPVMEEQPAPLHEVMRVGGAVEREVVGAVGLSAWLSSALSSG